MRYYLLFSVTCLILSNVCDVLSLEREQGELTKLSYFLSKSFQGRSCSVIRQTKPLVRRYLFHIEYAVVLVRDDLHCLSDQYGLFSQ